jgi:hypothetical protein
MGLCDAHTANCWASEERAYARQAEESEHDHWEQVMSEVLTWTEDWECFADLDLTTPNEKAQILDFTKRLRGWLDEHGEFWKWQASAEDLPREPFLPSQQNTPVYPEAQTADSNKEIPL